MNQRLIFKIVLLLLAFIWPNVHSAQIVITPKGMKSDDLAPVGGPPTKLFFPFRGTNELQEIYDSDKFNTSKSVSFSSIFRDSMNAPTSYVDVISFIPNNSAFRFGTAVQLTSAESKDTSLISRRDVALQRLINGGGNIVLAFNRPYLYTEFYKTNFFIMNATVAGFFDVPFVNEEIYDPGAGLQLSTDFDFRIFTEGSERQPGNVFRLGVKGKGAWNVVNGKYFIANKNEEFRNVAFAQVQPYLGLTFLNFEYSFYFSGSKLFDNRRQVLLLTIVPVKF